MRFYQSFVLTFGFFVVCVAGTLKIPSLFPSCTYECPSKSSPVQNPSYNKTANGCGSKGIIIDADHLPKPQMELCCNDHDFCYDTCNSGKAKCDLIFKECLLNVCSTTRNIETMMCKATAELFYNVVKDIGCVSYLDAQKMTCLCH